MNIGFFSPTINKTGGGELVTLHMIKALQEKGHKITVASFEKIDRQHIQNFLGSQIEFKELIFKPKLFDPYAMENIYPNIIKSFIFSFKCDILIDPFSNSIFPWLDAVYFQGIPWFISSIHGVKRFAFAPSKAFLNFYSNSNQILMTCSKYVASNIKNSTGFPVNVLYPPVSDFFKFRGEASSKTDLLVAAIRISMDKNPESIIKIIKLLPDNYSLTFIGSCKTLEEAKMLDHLNGVIDRFGLQKRVKLMINVSRDEQRKLLQKAKIYIHPFITYEAFGISVVEAMSAGCIPIVPNFGGLKEIVPSNLRYNSLEEAASLIEESASNWNASKNLQSIEIAEKFNSKRFSENFIKLMRL